MKRISLSCLLILMCISIYPLNFTYKGLLYYVSSTDNRTVSLIRDDLPATYKGVIEIPEVVIYNDVEFTVTKIEDYTFVDSKITGLILPKTVTKLGDQLFNNCQQLEYIKVDKDNPKFCDVNGVLFSKDQTKLLQYPNAKGSEYSLPESTKIIGEKAFITCLSLKKIILNDGLEEIRSEAFYYDKELKELKIPSSVIKITSAAFYRCNLSKLWLYSTNPCYVFNDTFPDEMYINTVVYVPQGCIDAYKSSSYWYKFYKIEEFDATEEIMPSDIKKVFENNQFIVSSLYTLDGKQVKDPLRGLNIIHMNDGTTKKVLVK